MGGTTKSWVILYLEIRGAGLDLVLVNILDEAVRGEGRLNNDGCAVTEL